MASVPRLDGRIDPQSTALIAIALCREGKWQRAYDYLNAVAQYRHSSELPALFYSYLGLATARVRRQTASGLRFCELATRRDPCCAEAWANLVALRLMAGDESRAWRDLTRGLELVPGDPRLLQLRREEFSRQPVALSFLQRRHPLNVLLGRVRHRVRAGSVDSV